MSSTSDPALAVDGEDLGALDFHRRIEMDLHAALAVGPLAQLVGQARLAFGGLGVGYKFIGLPP